MICAEPSAFDLAVRDFAARPGKGMTRVSDMVVSSIGKAMNLAAKLVGTFPKKAEWPG